MEMISQMEALGKQAVEIQGNIDKARKDMVHACKCCLVATALDASYAQKQAESQSYAFWRALRTLGLEERIRGRAYEIEKENQA